MFIAFDGMDGAGKSTQVERLEAWLRDSGRVVHRLDLGRTPYFYELLQRINSRELSVPAEIREMIYYFEGLYANINYIRTTARDEFVLIDRYYLSYFAYGLENGMTEEQIAFYTKNLIEPDLYFFLDADVGTTRARIKSYRSFDAPELGYRYDAENAAAEDVDARFTAFQSRVRENYLSHIREGHRVIDATQPEILVEQEIRNAFEKMV